jgi:hypothetical protein
VEVVEVAVVVAADVADAAGAVVVAVAVAVAVAAAAVVVVVVVAVVPGLLHHMEGKEAAMGHRGPAGAVVVAVVVVEDVHARLQTEAFDGGSLEVQDHHMDRAVWTCRSSQSRPWSCLYFYQIPGHPLPSGTSLSPNQQLLSQTDRGRWHGWKSNVRFYPPRDTGGGGLLFAMEAEIADAQKTTTKK